MTRYLRPSQSIGTIFKRLNCGLTKDAARFRCKEVREQVTGDGAFRSDERLLRYAMRPFDLTMAATIHGVRPLWNEPRPDYVAQCWHGNAFLLSPGSQVRQS